MKELTDEHFMNVALEEARKTLIRGNFPVGVVIIHYGTIISKGHNRVNSENSNLAHAELEAIAPIQKFLFEHKQECEIFTTLEPCMMCFGAILNCRFKRLVFSACDPTFGISTLKYSESYLSRVPEIISGVLIKQSLALIEEYIIQMDDNNPWKNGAGKRICEQPVRQIYS